MKTRGFCNSSQGVIWVVTLILLTATASAQRSLSYSGDGGFDRSFNLVAGEYKLDLDVRHPILGYVQPGFKSCLFTGVLERVAPTHDKLSLGSAIELSADDLRPYWRLHDKVTLEEGRYTLYIAFSGDCKWDFSLTLLPKNSSSSSPLPAALAEKCSVVHCIRPPLALTWGTLIKSDEVFSLSATKIEFIATFMRFDGLEPSGKCVIKKGKQPIEIDDLKVEHDDKNGSDHFYIIEEWGAKSTQYLGKITVEFVTNVGTSSADFTVVP